MIMITNKETFEPRPRTLKEMEEGFPLDDSKECEF